MENLRRFGWRFGGTNVVSVYDIYKGVNKYFLWVYSDWVCIWNSRAFKRSSLLWIICRAF